MQKAATLLALFCITAFAQQKGTFTDTRDGKTYKITKIGEQVWMAENLNYEAEGSKCYNDSISYCGKYGRLYKWSTAMKACPKGWHLPSNDEWDKLFRHVDGDKGTKSPYESETAGKYLKSKEGWNWNNDDGISGNGEDTYGFSALPDGYGNPNGSFGDVGDYCQWWSSSEDDSDYAYIRYMVHDLDNAFWVSGANDRLYSVRCVGD
ncbi:MAG: fibrobacter succinogenes major paralogous domain-containing protein [Fibromonadaceae bacterium]|jgi:uncharacterized protein (TIGR02145 family)|nr:fibrobacter succinogenes major paralogous domain-containing protein [Fibromonadaceae bacterium]